MCAWENLLINGMNTSKVSALIVCLMFSSTCFAQGVLKVSGKKVIDPATGAEIMFHGVNLGGWLVTENWMCGIQDGSASDSDGRSALQTLEKRFSSSEVRLLVKKWQDNWITSADFDRIHALGFNFVRVPFWYRNLQDKDLNWELDSLGNIDFTRFDWIVSEAKKRNLHVLFDYHIWLDQNKKYDGISGVDSVVKHTAKIWKAFATHFKGNPTILGYDLLNEPTGSYNGNVMGSLYDTVRSVDPDHIISIEWTDVDTTRWKNVIYQEHFYGLDGPTLADNKTKYATAFTPLVHKYDSLNVPCYVGEFQASQINDTALTWLLDQFCTQKLHWSGWTYKTVNMWGWGMLSVYPDSVQVNVSTDSFSKILHNWSQLSVPANWYELQNVKAGWIAGAACTIGSTPVATIQKNRSKISCEAPLLSTSSKFVDLQGKEYLQGNYLARGIYFQANEKNSCHVTDQSRGTK